MEAKVFCEHSRARPRRPRSLGDYGKKALVCQEGLGLEEVEEHQSKSKSSQKTTYCALSTLYSVCVRTFPSSPFRKI